MSKFKITSILLFFCFLGLGSWIYSNGQEEFKYDSQGKRNPFIPLVTPEGRLLQLEKAAVKGNITVEGIIYDKSGSSYAIVNGSVVKVGDFISGLQVLKIEKTKVVFVKDGKTQEIGLKKEAE